MTVAIYDNEMKEASSKAGQRNENSNTRDVGDGQTGIKMRSGGQMGQAVGNSASIYSGLLGQACPNCCSIGRMDPSPGSV